jgi:hypothetical protein
MDRRTTRVTMTDGSVIAELWTWTAQPCPHCRAAGHWVDPRQRYHVCTAPACRRGWEPDRSPQAPAENPVLRQLVEQLERAA